jgi:hypothetical protein
MSMQRRWFHAVSAVVLGLLLSTVGCANQDEAAPQPAGGNDQVQEGELRQQLSDAALEGKLKGILQGVTFTSESDYPYIVLVGDQVTERRLSTRIVREKLRAVVKDKSSSHRDIQPTTCRSSRLSVSQAIADGDAAVVPADPNEDDFGYAHHDKQLMIALKTMRAQLKSVVGYTFGTNESGDQDEVGPVLYIWVGISKTTGKLIAIMTEAVYT